VLSGLALGIAVGHWWPDFGASLKPLGDGFVENSARMRTEYYREEAARFRSLAELEPIAALRRHLAVMDAEHRPALTA